MPGACRRIGKGSIVVRETLGIRQPSWAVLGANWSKRATSRELPTGIHASGANQHRNISGQGPFRKGRRSVALAFWRMVQQMPASQVLAITFQTDAFAPS